MRIVITFILSAILLYIGSNQLGSLPPIGSFFSPYHGFWKNAEVVNEYNNEELDIPGLSSPVRVVMDDKLIPHIFAENQSDALMVQGYLHAKYRLWQMDMTHRSTLGRLSEVLGKRTIDYDKKQRRIGLPAAARKVYAEWKKDELVSRLMQSYSKGVNAFIEQLTPADYPLEFKLLNYKPEKFDAFNIAVLYISMANVLCSYNLDIEQSNNLNWLGQKDFDDLFPNYNAKQSPIIPEDHIWEFNPELNKSQETRLKDIGQINCEPYHPHSPELGSNNWVISPGKSASGHAILCNDPHLNLTLPSVWYENHIVTPDLNVYGVSFPGAPGIIIGFNEDIAWGTTNGGHDVMDWYKIQWADADKKQYLLDGQKVNAEIKVEEIKIKGGSVVYDSIIYTYWGPVWNKEDQDMALKWVIHNDLQSNSFSTFIKLNSAKNYDDYRSALAYFEAPIQNLVFASKTGDIALSVQGKIPLRHPGNGGIALDGSMKENDWQGFVPNNQLPSSKNPEQGYLASANQHSTDPSYPYYYHGKFEDYRGRVINQLISEKENISILDCQNFQTSGYSIVAKELTEAILPHIDIKSLTAIEKEFLKLFINWDYTFKANGKIPTLFAGLRKNLNPALWDEFISQPNHVTFPETWKSIEILQAEENHPFIDNLSTSAIENKTDLCTAIFKESCKDYNSIADIPAWHIYKSTTISHLARIDAFSIDVDTDGYAQALNAQTSTTGPSWRMIVEMSDPIKAIGVYPGGQSGNPGSPHYDDMIDTWSAGKYYDIQFVQSPDQIKHKTYELHAQ